MCAFDDLDLIINAVVRFGLTVAPACFAVLGLLFSRDSRDTVVHIGDDEQPRRALLEECNHKLRALAADDPYAQCALSRLGPS